MLETAASPYPATRGVSGASAVRQRGVSASSVTAPGALVPPREGPDQTGRLLTRPNTQVNRSASSNARTTYHAGLSPGDTRWSTHVSRSSAATQRPVRFRGWPGCVCDHQSKPTAQTMFPQSKIATSILRLECFQVAHGSSVESRRCRRRCWALRPDVNEWVSEVRVPTVLVASTGSAIQTGRAPPRNARPGAPRAPGATLLPPPAHPPLRSIRPSLKSQC
jgi:hypothetical protein